ncbi:MAG: hypothetical protein ABW120_04430 [Sedimenticola sp.]
MHCQIVRSEKYFTIKHTSETLNRAELELGYSQLTDMARLTAYKTGVCDFSSIKEVTVTEKDARDIINAMVYIFETRPEFHLITIVPDTDVKVLASNIHSQLRKKFGYENLHLVPDAGSAGDIIDQLETG